MLVAAFCTSHSPRTFLAGQEARNASSTEAQIQVSVHTQFHPDFSSGVSSGDTSSLTVGVFVDESSLFVDSVTLTLDPTTSPDAAVSDVCSLAYRKFNPTCRLRRCMVME